MASNNNNINDTNNDDKLSTGAIVGIIFGCIGFLLLVARVIFYFIYKSKKNKINDISNEETIRKEEEKGEQIDEKEKENEVQIYNTKRAIHNIKEGEKWNL